MTSFIDIKYPARHHGADRLESAMDTAQQVSEDLAGTRGLATLLLSGMVAAVMVVAYQVMDSVAEGHLLVMWVTLWAAAFGVIAVFAGAARNLAVQLGAGLDSWSRSLAEARADQRLWDAARNDHRVMADLQSAMLREEARGEVEKESASAPLTPAIRAERAIQRRYPQLRESYNHCF